MRTYLPTLNALVGASSLVALLVIGPADARAQANRGSTASGAFGQTTLGSTGGARPQTTGQGTTSAMNGMNGQTGLQQGMTGTSGQMGSTGQLGQAGGGMQNLQRGGNLGFVGISSAAVQNPFASGQQGRLSNVNFNTLTQLMTRSRQNQFNAQQAQKSSRGNSQATSQFRVPMRLGFQPMRQPAAQVSGQLSSRLTKIPGLSRVGPIQVEFAGTTAVLRGTVASEADRQLAEGLARLEPEVQGVVNELEVAAPSTPVEALPPATAP
jgi:hypothetical protein